ncbi:MAG: four helix bundle protein [Pirellulaceae bacterium]|nr:four helix bundle protein [Pirellulaceae bacterium]
MPTRIVKHTDLKVYQQARAAAGRIFEVSKKFPKSEQYSLTDQIRRCSRSVCGNIAEAWRKRRYPNAFVCKLNDSEGEAAETQVWLEFAVECKYVDRDEAAVLYRDYDKVIGMLVSMINRPENWQV